MQQKQFYSLNKEEYKAISFEKGYLCDQYEALNSFLKLHFDASAHKILGKPINTQDSINWYTNSNKTFRQLDSNDNEHLKKYNAFLYDIQRKCIQLESDEDADTRSWALLLKEVFNLDNNIVFTDGENLIIVWGYKFNLRKNYFVPFVEFGHLTNQVEPIEDDQISDDIPLDNGETDDITNEEVASIPPIIEDSKPDATKAPIAASSNSIHKKEHWFLLMLNSIERFAKKYWY